MLAHLADYLRKLQARTNILHEHGRVKMWLAYLKQTWPQAAALHDAIRRLHDAREILDVIAAAQTATRHAGQPSGDSLLEPPVHSAA